MKTDYFCITLYFISLGSTANNFLETYDLVLLEPLVQFNMRFDDLFSTILMYLWKDDCIFLLIRRPMKMLNI